MRKGSRHNWTYRGHWYERKVKPGVWRFRFGATKFQKPRKGVGKGSKYVWRIKATQRAVKTQSGRYRTRMHGFKSLIKATPRRRKKWPRTSRRRRR